MFTTFRKSTLRLSVFAICIFSAAAASAHPEMDACGRDISSGPVIGLCLQKTVLADGPSAASTLSEEVTTQSTDALSSLTPKPIAENQDR